MAHYTPSSEQPLAGELRARLARIDLVALDVDGTLTEGRIPYATGSAGGGSAGADAELALELQSFHVHDGQGLAWLRDIGVRVVWITGRGSAATRRRAEELGIARLVEKSGPKDGILERIQAEFGLGPDRTLAMGDDLPDLRLFARASVCASPSDGLAAVRSASDIVSAQPGGRGAVREICDHLLDARSFTGAGPGDPRERYV